MYDQEHTLPTAFVPELRPESLDGEIQNINAISDPVPLGQTATHAARQQHPEDKRAQVWGPEDEARARAFANDSRIVYAVSVYSRQWHIEPDLLRADAIIRLTRSRSLQPEDDIFGYINRLVQRLCIDEVRARSAQKRPRTTTITGEHEVTIPDAVAVNEINLVETRRELNILIGGLSDKHREIIRMVYIDGLTVPEAAKKLGLSVGTAKSRTWWALHHMKNHAEERGLTLWGLLS